MKSYLAKKGEITPKWYIIDASNQILGKLAVTIANIIRGRNKPQYTPHTDTGDFVIIINAEKVIVTGKKETQKEYMFYSGYRGNEYRRNVDDFREKRPEFIIHHAVKGMLPKNRLSQAMLKKLKVYKGVGHLHEAQQPQPLTL